MPVRLIGAVAVLVSAGVHFKLWMDGMRYLHLVGPAFMLNAIAGVVIAVLLVTWRHWIPLFLEVGFGVSTLGAFTIASTVGLFGDHERWSGPYVWTAAVVEVVAIVTGCVAAFREGYLGSARRAPERVTAH